MSRRLPTCLGLAILAAASSCFGQGVSPPVVTSISPPGGTIGQTLEWSISGRNLGKAKSLFVSGGGVEVVDFKVQGEEAATAKVRLAPDAAGGFREVRVDGPGGLSNLAIVRVDHLPQVNEVEPNDVYAQAQEVTAGSAVVGLLKAVDLDHYKVKGKPGQRLTVDLEARRVGTSISPLVTIYDARGVPLAQGRELRGGDRDCRIGVTVPPEGSFVVQVRDSTYGGGDQARYRLRFDPAPYATGIFPLGGQKGQAVEVEVCGGNLERPIRKTVKLPATAGRLVEVGSVEAPGGYAVASPGRLIIGEGAELVEPLERAGESPIDLPPGVTVEGRIARPEEVDRYRLPVKAGEKVRVKVEAAALGSWLDSVVAVRDASGNLLGENDDTQDAVSPNQARSVSALGVPEGSSDSSLEVEAKADGWLTVEVTDRFGDGGPEYAYRLTFGTPRPDFHVNLLLGNATTNAQALNNVGQGRIGRVTPGLFGVFNLKPGASAPINFLVTPEGRPGRVEVRFEGLPEGVTCEPVTIRFPSEGSARPGEPGTGPASPMAEADFLLLKVAPYVQPGLSELRIVATSKPSPGVVIEHDATATIGVDAASVSGRPITRTVNRFPLRIVGEARPLFVGPPAPPTLRKVTVPGPLLLGDRIDLGLQFDRAISAGDGSVLEARAEGAGLATNTVISAGTTANEDETAPEAVIHVLASAKAATGPHPVKVSFTPPGGSVMVQEVTVEVRPPIELTLAADSIFLGPGETAGVEVKVRREVGFAGEVEIKLEGLPRTVKAPKSIVIAANSQVVKFDLEMDAAARPIEKGREVRVVGMVRMSRGNVTLEAKTRPMIRPKPAEK